MPDQELPTTITWQAQSRQQKRSPLWYIGFLIVTAALVLFAVFIDHSIITLITFILLSLVVFVFTMQRPGMITYKLTKVGVHADEAYYPYSAIKKFWILYNPPHVKNLNFQSTAYLNNKIQFELGSQDPLQVKRFLNQHITEDHDQGEHLFETIARTLKI